MESISVTEDMDQPSSARADEANDSAVPQKDGSKPTKFSVKAHIDAINFLMDYYNFLAHEVDESRDESFRYENTL